MRYLRLNDNRVMFISIHLLLLFIYLWFYQSNPTCTSLNLKMMGGFGWAQFFISVVGWKRITGKVFVPYVIFLLAAYTFCMGQAFLEVFNLIVEERSVYNRCSASEIYSAEVYTLLFLAFFHIGALVDYKKPSGKTIFNETSRIKIVENEAIKNIGKIYVVVSVIPFIIENFVKYQIVSTYGYMGLYEFDPGIPLWGLITLLSDFFMPGVLCILLTSSPNSKKQRSIFILFAVIILILMYCGGRSQGVVLVAVTLLYYQNYVKPISKKGWAILCVSGVFFISMLSVIAHLRSGSRDRYVEDIVNYKAEDSNPFFETISEMGGSIYPMARTMYWVPQTEPYRYGETYLYALSSLIPNMGFWEKHPAAVKANLAEWLMKRDNLTYSPAYSLVAEAYINFGVAGFVFMFILGVYFSRVLNIESENKHKMLSFLVAIIFTYMSLQMVRNCFFGIVRTLTYYILPIYWYVSYKINRAKLKT